MLGESESVPLRLLNPFTRSRVSNDTPRVFSPDTLPRVLNFMNFKVVELIEAFYLSDKHIPHHLRKVVLFPSLSVKGGLVCALFDYGRLRVRTIEDKKWIKLNLNNYIAGYHCHDIIIQKGQLYVIDNLGTIFWMNPWSLKLVQFTQPLWLMDNGKRKQMVEYGGRLYVVDMPNFRDHLHEKIDIKVYKVDEESGRWENVRNLGDVVFVLGKDSNFSLLAKDYHGCERNCIYFSFSYAIYNILCFSLKDSMLKFVKYPFWPCPSLFNH
ncbi:hypothetical protein OROGR_023695 [Orobanche gracilis]